MAMTEDLITLSKQLIQCPSITPQHAGTFAILQPLLESLGFDVQIVQFDDTTNMYARIGNKSPHLCFVGHVDVVPAGDLQLWDFDPFAGVEHAGYIYGRGAVDMKGAIACFVVACQQLLGAKLTTGAKTIQNTQSGQIIQSIQSTQTKQTTETMQGAQTITTQPMQSTQTKQTTETMQAMQRAQTMQTTNPAQALSATSHNISPQTTNTTDLNGSISILLTSDEEGAAVNGIPRMIPWLEENKQQIDLVLVGEPTSTDEHNIGDQIKVGRRGSVTANLTCYGTQGHIANRPDNPITRMVQCLQQLINLRLDDGTDNFEPSSLEITTIDVGNPATNVTPARISANFGIRYNNLHSGLKLQKLLTDICAQHAGQHALHVTMHGEPYLTTDQDSINLVANATNQATARHVHLSTSGATTDGRFMTRLAPVVEVGLGEEHMHKCNERVPIKSLELLSTIYQAICSYYLNIC